MNPRIRDPMNRMYPKTFCQNFEKEPCPSNQNSSWLCFEVETKNSAVFFHRGVFRNQGPVKTPCHAEECFLTWIQGVLPPDHHYHVTWYVSRGPCANCANLIVHFLAMHRRVTLTIFAAHLNFFWESDFQQGLLRMDQEGVQLHIMGYEEFEYCWDNFVYNQRKQFVPWNGLNENYEFMVSTLEDILRSPLDRIRQKDFSIHFRNSLWLDDKSTWLCFEVKRTKSPVPLYRGVFRNQSPPKTPCHAEVRFFTWLQDLPPDFCCQFTWYLSWSPCADCADLVANFLAKHRNVSLTIFVARLYYYRDPEMHRGLRRMYQEGANVDIMSVIEFEYCWDNFVYNQGKQFVPWNGLNENYEFLVPRLQEILEQMDPLVQQHALATTKRPSAGQQGIPTSRVEAGVLHLVPHLVSLCLSEAMPEHVNSRKVLRTSDSRKHLLKQSASRAQGEPSRGAIRADSSKSGAETHHVYTSFIFSCSSSNPCTDTSSYSSGSCSAIAVSESCANTTAVSAISILTIPLSSTSSLSCRTQGTGYRACRSHQ
ncbi:DNA dC-_dU-editing enzyme APOBEC-3F-like isoform X2 [Otolemur garnettii]|uniref:DNA dC->dU-editing enzyme APOBEC-3F-like isoform X2 n=1 Tax=Otolemur garnettii TaxID=30611 RepID=UPI000C7EE34C|nr:DNA dC->dU-editing enzyme APOBEC-3F-like isoform X2 [Otolemur garnettii]